MYMKGIVYRDMEKDAFVFKLNEDNKAHYFLSGTKYGTYEKASEFLEDKDKSLSDVDIIDSTKHTKGVRPVPKIVFAAVQVSRLFSFLFLGWIAGWVMSSVLFPGANESIFFWYLGVVLFLVSAWETSIMLYYWIKDGNLPRKFVPKKD